MYLNGRGTREAKTGLGTKDSGHSKITINVLKAPPAPPAPPTRPRMADVIASPCGCALAVALRHLTDRHARGCQPSRMVRRHS